MTPTSQEHHMTTRHSYDDTDALREAMFGRSVVSVQIDDDDYSPEGRVLLDDGTELILHGNDGGCSCGGGDYALTRLNDMPINGITNVEIDVDEHDGYSLTYRIFVLAQDQRFELAAFEGNDGSGYYGTGFWFTVNAPTPKEPTT